MSAAIGVLFPGEPTTRRRWSGTPSSIVDGLEQMGVDVHAVNVNLPPGMSRWISLVAGGATVASVARAGVRPTPHELRRVGAVSPTLAALMSRAAKRRLADSRPLDGLVQIGTGYTVASAVPIVTYEDMTIVQARDAGYEVWRALSSRALAARVERQRDGYQRARACCTATHWAASSIISDYGVPAEKVHVVGLGRNVDPGELAADRFERQWSPPRLLFVGRDWQRKNGARVLAAFARLRAEVADAQLDVVGAHPALRAEGVVGHGVLRLEDDADRAKLAELFARATCFVMPSLHEPAGIVYVEASAWGIPSIATRNGGAGEFVGDGGIVVDPYDEDALLQAMRTLCEPAAAARLGGLAKHRSRLFSSRAMGGRLLRALDLPCVETDELPAFA